MMKRFLFYVLACALLGSTTDVYGQKWLKKIGQALDNVTEALNETSDVLGSTSSSSGNISASDGAFKIVTNHPDFKIKVTRCEASGRTCILDFLMENQGTSDVSLHVESSSTVGFDDEANEYDCRQQMFLTVSGKDATSFSLRAGVPIKGQIRFESVPESAQSFRRIDLSMRCDAWGLSYTKPVILKNVPITHEGE
jgi:hypothetical protein